jgi:Reverse transcriptase (RNA-dependent DNA polymerase)
MGNVTQRKSKTNEIYRWKSRLNIGGHKQREGFDYDQTYAPVVGWPAIRLLLTMVLIHGWHTIMIDYVQAYPQAPVERPMFMEIPKGFKANAPKGDDYVLEILRNIYGSRQAGRVWNLYLVAKLKTIGFVQSEHDECVFYRGKAMYLLYTDDSILAGPDPKELAQITKDMQKCGLKITTEGDIEDFLGVNISRRTDGTFELTQKRLIDSERSRAKQGQRGNQEHSNGKQQATFATPYIVNIRQPLSLSTSHWQIGLSGKMHSTRLGLCSPPVCAIQL